MHNTLLSLDKVRTRKAPFPNMSWIPGGTFTMGSDAHYPEEAPAHQVTVDGFWMDQFTVTNAQFSRFVEDTNYVTSAERTPLVPSSVVFQRPGRPVNLRNHSDWWTYVPGASWRHPLGPCSSLKGLHKHPVVHVAYEDARAYALWADKQLPTEAEWEFAARGGLEGAEFVWGDEFEPDGKVMANTWQGEFPNENLLTDGFEWTAPVGSFPANGYGLYDMAGNVWEWTTDSYQEHSKLEARKVVKGGSFLCAPNYCRHYRPAARMTQPVDTSTCDLGFRCIVRP